MLEIIYYNAIMNDVLTLRSAIDLIDSGTSITWSNKYVVPKGYEYNDLGYVITNEPRPMLRACVGVVFGFLVRMLGLREYIRQNLIVLRLLNPGVHRSILVTAFYYSIKKVLVVDRVLVDEISKEVYELTEIPTLNSNFISWRRTWFSEGCAYDTVSKIVRLENNNKIDSDRELMPIHTKYITMEVAEFTGFSRSKIDRYWSEKQWDKKLRTLFTLDEAVTELNRRGIAEPDRKQLAEVSGLSVATISGAMRDIKKIVAGLQLNK